MAQTVASPSSVKSLPKKTAETKKESKETSDYSGMKDPSLKELHLQFVAGIRTYLDQSLNDPNAAGYAYRLNSPVTNLSFSSKPVVIPGGTQGIIQAIP
jgi:hypothetical protein